MEFDSDRVKLGKWVDENTYKRSEQIDILDKRIKVDFIKRGDNGIELHEVKSSKIPKKEHRLQLGFYLLKMEESGINAIGVLNYPEINKIVKLEIEDVRMETMAAIDGLLKTLNDPCPTRLNRTACKGCAYFDLCYASEGDSSE